MNKITILLLAILLVSASALKFRQPPANATEGGQGKMIALKYFEGFSTFGSCPKFGAFRNYP